jgi:hypothetical protein
VNLLCFFICGIFSDYVRSVSMTIFKENGNDVSYIIYNQFKALLLQALLFSDALKERA